MLKTDIMDFELDGVFTNGSGAYDDTLEKLIQIANSRAGFITTKTTTFLPRIGNPGPRFYAIGNTTINSMGLPNPGYVEMVNIISELKKKTKKPVFVSMSGFDANEAEIMSKTLSEIADVLELNLSCPNLKGKSQIIYDAEATNNILKAVRKNTNKKIAVKAAPFLDASAQSEFCEIVTKNRIDIIVAINTLGNSMYIDADKAKIMLKPKWGGLGGEAIKMIGWGNVRRYYEYFKGTIPIIGCGGIYSGKDAFAYALAGASAFAATSVLYEEGISAFARMESELENELKKHGYTNLKDAVGKAEE
ncbi:MAG: dihydroorotate oxidase [Candidatus Micrarchaeota archaeon]